MSVEGKKEAHFQLTSADGVALASRVQLLP